jgi:CHAT domain-containing protein
MLSESQPGLLTLRIRSHAVEACDVRCWLRGLLLVLLIGRALFQFAVSPVLARERLRANGDPAHAQQLQLLTAEEVQPGAEPTATPESLDKLGERAAAYYDAKDWEKAYAASNEAAQAVERMIVRISRPGEFDPNFGATTQVSGADSERAGSSALGLYSRFFRRKILSAWWLGQTDPARADNVADEAFKAAQMIDYSSTQQAHAQLSARIARGDDELAKLVRERQDLSAHDLALWHEGNSDDAVHDDINRKISRIDKSLAKRFPEYSEHLAPRPLSIAEVQRGLGSDEVLLLYFESYEMAGIPEALIRCDHAGDCESGGEFMAWERSMNSPEPTEKAFAWLIGKDKSKWVRLPLDRRGIGARALRLRCGLDGSLWTDPSGWPDSPAKIEQAASLKRCRELTEDTLSVKSTLPFDFEIAHELFEMLFRPISKDIEGRQLLIVPSKSMRSLPYSVLLTEPPAKQIDLGEYKRAAWLGRRNAISMLPAVASLRIRDLAKGGRRSTDNRRPYLGFGNPLLDGPTAEYAQLKQAAAARQKCGRGSIGTSSLARQLREVDMSQLKRAAPLPETADELCNVASTAAAAENDVFLGARATERELKRLNKENALASYRILHFATHGAMAGQVSGSTEPGLLLTPPKESSDLDDGFLTASEVAELKLDADWVVLSACNTAAGESQYAEPTSGLARSFIYAGTRALLISHWYVDSNATVALIKGIFAAQHAAPTISRAEALRRSMAALIDGGNEDQAHPAIWAPFALFGAEESTP